jgi:hypothetical protein
MLIIEDIFQHKKDLSDAVRRINPASVNTAPNVFWDVEGSLKTVSCDIICVFLTDSISPVRY